VRIAVASGKGGTGKTAVAVSLAVAAARRGMDTVYVDADVEEPNGHLFIRPEISERKRVKRLVPVVDQDACTGCGRCGEVCRYGAIAWLGRKVLTFPELCHSCGGCSLLCPANAIREEDRDVGEVRRGKGMGIDFIEGILDVGEAMSPPVIRAAKKSIPSEGFILIDGPPGTSCPAVEAIRGVDYILLVAEPTPFGRHDLGLAVDLTRHMGLPTGVVINRAGEGKLDLRGWCEERDLPVLMEIRESRTIAETITRGGLMLDAAPEMESRFASLAQELSARKESVAQA